MVGTMPSRLASIRASPGCAAAKKNLLLREGDEMFFHPFFAFTDADRWVPGIGDPTPMGWITVFGYFVAAILCCRCLLVVKPRRSSEGFFWGALFAAMVLLGINKQLDLQTWLTLTARRLAQSEGWYENRRVVQVIFIFLVGVAGVFSFYGIWKLAAGSRKNRLVLAGFLFLCSFVLIRAASFHHVDLFLKYDIGGMKMNWIFELTGIILIAVGAWRRLRAEKAKSAESHAFVFARERPRNRCPNQ
jgi:hypothetical protein